MMNQNLFDMVKDKIWPTIDKHGTADNRKTALELILNEFFVTKHVYSVISFTRNSFILTTAPNQNCTFVYLQS